MPVAEATLEERIIAHVREWDRKYQCPDDTAALCHDLGVAPDVLALALARMESAGTIARVVRGPFMDVLCR